MSKHQFRANLTDILAFCDICKAGEGELSTHCPGRAMSEPEKWAIYKRHWDFKSGFWHRVSVNRHPSV